MSRIRWQDHISVAEDLHHGDPCIKGTRIPVRILIGSLADGMQPGEILGSYPQLSERDLLAALAYAADVLSHESVKVDENRPREVAPGSYGFLLLRPSEDVRQRDERQE